MNPIQDTLRELSSCINKIDTMFKTHELFRNRTWVTLTRHPYDLYFAHNEYYYVCYKQTGIVDGYNLIVLEISKQEHSTRLGYSSTNLDYPQYIDIPFGFYEIEEESKKDDMELILTHGKELLKLTDNSLINSIHDKSNRTN